MCDRIRKRKPSTTHELGSSDSSPCAHVRPVVAFAPIAKRSLSASLLLLAGDARFLSIGSACRNLGSTCILLALAQNLSIGLLLDLNGFLDDLLRRLLLHEL